MCKFEEGDIVRFKGGMYGGWRDGNWWYGGRGYAIGTVKGLWFITDCEEYMVVAEGDDDRDYYIVDDYNMKAININDIEADDEAVLGRPSFKIGDIVGVADDLDKMQAVREVIIVKTGEMPKYMYEVSPLDSDDQVCTYEEDSLELLYHDSIWEKYFTEHIQNILPEWRGELYNFDIFRGLDGYRLSREYCKDTLPPDRMEYILGEYSIESRIDAVLIPCKNLRIFEKLFKLGWKELSDTVFSILERIRNRNACDIDSDFKSEVSDKSRFRFTELELSIVSEIDKRDVSLGKYRYHYPVEMTYLQIMQAIKEAYSTARQIGMRKIVRPHFNTFSFNEYLLDKCDKINPVKGSALYEGVSEDGLVIRFWYNFDLDRIETAYPIRANNNSKKH